MSKDLVIVESPAKALTIGRFLGKNFVAKASMGHVRDLPTGKMGVEVNEKEKDFTPTYTNLKDKRKIISELTKASKEATTVYLATDPDREGEAISWHLLEAAKISKSKVKRVVFHEITREAVREAFNNPRELDYHLIDAQQARRILDRLVGYKLSPVLWGKVRRGLSAGRVQSVALRLVVDREEQVKGFIPDEYWTIEARLKKGTEGDKHQHFKANLHSIVGEKKQIRIGQQREAVDITTELQGASFVVELIKKRETRTRPSAPFITSTMQQEASRKLRFTARRTMQIAQQLYEGLDVNSEGTVGLITYMRTDSSNVSQGALLDCSTYIESVFGDEYRPDSPRIYKKKAKGAQEAHEAVRPTSIFRTPESIRHSLTTDQFKLYDLIWKRMVASQMEDAVFDSTRVDIKAGSGKSSKQYIFRSTGSIVKFRGFHALYIEDTDDTRDDTNQDNSTALPSNFVRGESIECDDLVPEQHFTQPPPRYSEATLIKGLEEEGIGRPSTYAPIIATIMDRDYVRQDNRRFVPTKLGIAVTKLLTEHFPNIMDTGFTAKVEEELDEIAEGERKWAPVLWEFYAPFDKAIEKAMKEAQRIPSSDIDEESDEFCEKCERPMVIKSGRFGRFLSCSGFPECKTARPLLARVGVDCPECGGDLVERKSKARGAKKFYGCANYPTCTFAVNQRPLSAKCPECSKMLVSSGKDKARCNFCDYDGPVPEAELVDITA